MNLFQFFLVVLILGAAGVCEAQADVKQSISAKYGAAFKAIKNKDTKPYELLLAPEFSHDGADGKKYSRTEEIRNLDTTVQNTFDKIDNWSFKITQFKMTGKDSAEATVEYVVDAKVKGDSSEAHLGYSTRDTWKNENGNWVITESRDVKVPKAKPVPKKVSKTPSRISH